MPTTVEIYKASTKSGKKFKVVVVKNDGTKKTISFGAKGMSDYTKHKDKSRKELYIGRHKAQEKWGKSGVMTAGFWSRWILWNKPTLGGSIKDTATRFNLTIRNKTKRLK